VDQLVGLKAVTASKVSVMEDEQKTKDQLIVELKGMRQRLEELEAAFERSACTQTETALKESEEHYRELFENACDMVYTHDFDGNFKSVNAAGPMILGYSTDEFLTLNVRDIVAPEYLPLVQEKIRSKQCELGSATSTYEIVIHSRDGEQHWLELSTRTIRKDDKPWGVHGIARDITHRKKYEQAVRESERKLAQIIEFLPDPTFVIDAEGILVAWNRAVEELTGVKAADIVGKGNYEYAIPFYGERRPVLIDLVNRPDEEIEGTYLSVRRDGDRLVSESFLPGLKQEGTYLWNIARPLYDENGAVVGAIESVREITQRRRAEDALRSGERLLKSILDASPVGIGLSQHRKMVWVNDAWSRMFRFASESDYLGKGARIVYPSDEEYERVGKILYDNLGTGEVRGTETVLQRQDGSLFDAGLRMKALDPGNVDSGAIAVITDISKRKATERALRENEHRYRGLFEKSMDAILVVRPDGEILDANPACYELFGLTPEQLIGSPVLNLYKHPEDRAVYIRKMMEQGYVKEFLVELRRADGNPRSCVVNSTTWFNAAGEIVAFLTVARDITESKRLEEQLRQAQKMEAVGTLAAGIAHDFNNLLTVIYGFAEILISDKEEGSSEHEDLQMILQSARQGAELVRQIVTFSRSAEPNFQPLNLNRRIEKIRPLLHSAFPRMIQVRLVLAPDLAQINGDPAQIDQVLMNLAINAKEAMPERGRLTIETKNVQLDERFCTDRPTLKPGPYVMLAVSDLGRGMDRETQEKIFDPFFTTKCRTTAKGTGLGLPVVMGIVESHGGTIECSSALDSGTTFTAYFPTLPPEATTNS
jgi:PAS domain S-box-containing protein